MTADTRDNKNHFRIVVHEARCAYCGACVAVCPGNVITLFDVTLRIDHQGCTGCRQCVVICPLGALEKVDEERV